MSISFPDNTDEKISLNYHTSLELVRALHTAIVVIRQYPATNELVIKSMQQAYEILKDYLKQNMDLIVGEVGGNLLVGDLCLEEKDQQKPFVKTMVSLLSERKIQNITFLPEMTYDELYIFLEFVGKWPEKTELMEGMNVLLKKRNIENIKLNEKIYTITTSGEQEEEKFKEQIFSHLMEGVETSVVDKDQLFHALIEGNSQEIVNHLKTISSIGKEISHTPIIQFIQKMAELIKTASDKSIQEKLRNSLVSVFSLLDPAVLEDIFTSQMLPWNELPGLKEAILNSLPEGKYLELVRKICEHYKSIGTISSAEKKTELQIYNQLLEQLLLTAKGKYLARGIHQQFINSGLIDSSTSRVSKEEVDEEGINKYLLGENKEEEVAARVVAEVTPPRLIALLINAVQRIVDINLNQGKKTQVARLVEFIQRTAHLFSRITNPVLRDKIKTALAKAVSTLESSLLVGLLSHEVTNTIPELGFPNTVLSLLPEEKYLNLVEITHQEQKAENVESRKFLLEQFYNRLLLNSRGKELIKKISPQPEEPVDIKVKSISPETRQKILEVLSSVKMGATPEQSLTPVEEAKIFLPGNEEIWLSSEKIESIPKLIQKLDLAKEEDLMIGILDKLLLYSRHLEATVRQRVAISAIKIWIYAVNKGKDVLTKILVEKMPIWWKEETADKVFSLLLSDLDTVIKTLVIKENFDLAAELIDKLGRITPKENVFRLNEVSSFFHRLATEELMDIIINLFEFGNPKAQQFAERILITLGPISVKPLIKVLRRSETMKVRKGSLTLLQTVGKDSVPDIIAELKKPENPWYFTRNLIFLLGELGDEEVCSILVEPAAHPDVRVRRETLKILAKIGGGKAVPLVIERLNDQDLSIRKFAVETLGNWRATEAVPELMNLLRSKNVRDNTFSLQTEVCITLGEIKSSAAIPDLINIVKRPPWFLFRQGKNDVIRASACWALGEMGGPDSISSLEKAAQDSSAVVKQAARKALLQLTEGGD